jgi:lysophospholipid acyltransferase (LPLAT)-like uncharacterized protein
MKRITWKTRVLCWIALLIYRLLCSTYRVEYVHRDALEHAAKLHPAGSFVFGLWHEYFFTAVCTHPHQGIAPMISQSQDGEFISFIAASLGFHPVRGSTSRGGEQARTELYRRVNSGLKAAFTADGPRGPRRRIKSGLVDLSRTGRMAIVPLAVAASRAWRLHKSWDHSLIPKPFAKLVVIYGDPLMVAEHAHGLAFADEKRRIEAALQQVAERADCWFDRT